MENKTQYRIPAPRLAGLQFKLDKLSRRAVKLGLQPITLNIIGTEEEKSSDGLRVRVYHIVEIDGQEPKIAGWKFVAVLQHTSEGNVVRALPGEALPPEYRTIKPTCDHCKLARNRVDTYVLRHDDGTVKQVGSSCLRDFVGHGDPEAIAACAEFWLTAADYCESEESEDRDGGGRPQDFIYLPAFLGYVVRSVRVDGWLSRKKAEEIGTGRPATATLALSDMFPAPGASKSERVHPSDSDKKVAAEALEWAREFFTAKPELSDYEWNLSVSLKLDNIETRQAGLVASLIPYYSRETEKQLLARKQAAVSEFFGTVGKREAFDLTLARVYSFDSQFGTCYIYSFVDAAGNVAVWKSSSPAFSDDKIGQGFAVKATVKAHDVYSKNGPGVKQTVLTRLAIL